MFGFKCSYLDQPHMKLETGNQKLIKTTKDMDYKNTNAPKNTITRDMNRLVEPVGNVYETVAIIAKRANQISNGLKKELDAKLQDFSVPQDSLEETFENKEQIEISRSYEKLPKPTLMATQEFLEGDLIYKGSNKDEALK